MSLCQHYLLSFVCISPYLLAGIYMVMDKCFFLLLMLINLVLNVLLIFEEM
jgi:hypothetical protein